MFQLKKKPTQAAEDGKTFLRQARDEHAALFARFVANADEYDTVEEYTDAIESQAWEITEAVVKQSYMNGIRKGRAAGSTKKS
jgi:hypothetical protein